MDYEAESMAVAWILDLKMLSNLSEQNKHMKMTRGEITSLMQTKGKGTCYKSTRDYL
jgi:hypothetical protein